MEPVTLWTSQTFSRDELITALLEIGVKRDENPHRLWDFVCRKEEAIVWVDPDDDEHYPNPEVDELIERKLGSPPQTSIVLQISREPGSEPLAMELAIRFASRWPCVLDKLSGLAYRVLTLEELQALYENGLGLYEEEKGVSVPQEWIPDDAEYTTPEELAEMERLNREWLEEMEQEKKISPGFETPMAKEKQQDVKASESKRLPFPGLNPSQEWEKGQLGA
jgi:hypothetical protein